MPVSLSIAHISSLFWLCCLEFVLLFSAEHVQEAGIHVVDIAYAPLIGGFCVVLSNGSAALLTSPSSKFHPKVN